VIGGAVNGQERKWSGRFSAFAVIGPAGKLGQQYVGNLPVSGSLPLKADFPAGELTLPTHSRSSGRREADVRNVQNHRRCAALSRSVWWIAVLVIPTNPF